MPCRLFRNPKRLPATKRAVSGSDIASTTQGERTRKGKNRQAMPPPRWTSLRVCSGFGLPKRRQSSATASSETKTRRGSPPRGGRPASPSRSDDFLQDEGAIEEGEVARRTAPRASASSGADAVRREGGGEAPGHQHVPVGEAGARTGGVEQPAVDGGAGRLVQVLEEVREVEAVETLAPVRQRGLLDRPLEQGEPVEVPFELGEDIGARYRGRARRKLPVRMTPGKGWRARGARSGHTPSAPGCARRPSPRRSGRTLDRAPAGPWRSG